MHLLSITSGKLLTLRSVIVQIPVEAIHPFAPFYSDLKEGEAHLAEQNMKYELHSHSVCISLNYV